MEDADLERVDAAIRQMCERQQLAWVVTVVDAAIREGFSSSINPDSSSYHERGGTWRGLPGISVDQSSGRRPQPEVVERPYSRQEEVLLLLDALIGVYGDLPHIRQTAVNTLNQGWGGRVPLIDRVLIVDDERESGEQPLFEVHFESPEGSQPRDRVVRALLSLRAEVLA